MACSEPPAKRAKPEGVRASFLERFFAKYEFTCKHMLSCSDAESWKMSEVLEAADDECKQLWETCSLGYTESLGDPLLLQEIWSRYRDAASQELRRQSAEMSCDKQYDKQGVLQITTCVPVEGIYVGMMQLLQAGDHVICQAPAYQALYEIARSKECVLHQWQPHYDEKAHFWSFELEDLRRLLKTFSPEAGADRKHLRMLVVNSPHNPTGACFAQSQLDEIGDLLSGLQQEPSPIFFSDEMYSDLLAWRPSAVAKPSSIVLSGLSKPWGMPGLRVGWLLVQQPEHFQRIAGFRDYTTLCLPPQCEILGVVALRGGEKFLARNRALAQKNYELLQSFCLRNSRWFYPVNQHEHNALVTSDSFAAVTLFARLKWPLGGHAVDVAPERLKSVPKLVEFLAQSCSLCLVAGDFFEFANFSCVRFGIGRANFGTALCHLEEALSSL